MIEELKVATAARHTMGMAMVLVAWALVGGLVLPADVVYQLAVIVVSTMIVASLPLFALIAITGRNLW